MTDRSSGGAEDGDSSAILIPLQEARRERLDQPVRFDRRELDEILRPVSYTHLTLPTIYSV